MGYKPRADGALAAVHSPDRHQHSTSTSFIRGFRRDCGSLPISGGWGYTQEDAIVFVRAKFPRPSIPDFVELEYHIAQKIIYEELIVFRAPDDRFSGIDMKLKEQRIVSDGERTLTASTSASLVGATYIGKV